MTCCDFLTDLNGFGSRHERFSSLSGQENASAGDEAPVDGSAAVPLLKEVDEVAAAANEAAEKARLWKAAEIAERNAKQAAEEAKKRVEKVTVAAAQEEAEKAGRCHEIMLNIMPF